MIDKEELQRRVIAEEDYIRCPKFDDSLTKFTSDPKNSEGVKNSTIARLLVITEEEVEKLYQEAVQMLKDDMND